MDMWFNTTKGRHKKFELGVRVWRLGEERTCEECEGIVGVKHLDVNKHWYKMGGMVETARHICGMSEGPCRHKETWWWNEEVAEAVREKRIKFGEWRRQNSREAWMEYGRCRRSAGRVISSAKEGKC